MLLEFLCCLLWLLFELRNPGQIAFKMIAQRREQIGNHRSKCKGTQDLHDHFRIGPDLVKTKDQEKNRIHMATVRKAASPL